jgi:hypothetical protein
VEIIGDLPLTGDHDKTALLQGRLFENREGASVKVQEEVWTHLIQKIHSLEENPGRQLEIIRDAAPRFKEWFRQIGTVTAFHSFDLITLPYPRKYALWRAALSPVSYVWFTESAA